MNNDDDDDDEDDDRTNTNVVNLALHRSVDRHHQGSRMRTGQNALRRRRSYGDVSKKRIPCHWLTMSRWKRKTRL